MGTLNQRAEDTILAALLAGFWSGVLMDKLEALTLRFNMPVLHVMAQWWPLLLIASGVVLLVRHQFRDQRPQGVVVQMRPKVLNTNTRSQERVHAR